MITIGPVKLDKIMAVEEKNAKVLKIGTIVHYKLLCNVLKILVGGEPKGVCLFIFLCESDCLKVLRLVKCSH